ncbi:MAG: hypothetical protein B7Z40_09820 [Bosea sp. 12-68-7]|nr:MAG: hypothetical protein B7Z40_09820 [Bosea sp. 12-68-7]
MISARSGGGNDRNPEGSYASLDLARARLLELGSDPDCLVGEVEDYDPPIMASGMTRIVAQYDRQMGEWQEVTGELIPRTRGGEPGSLRRDAEQTANDKQA